MKKYYRYITSIFTIIIIFSVSLLSSLKQDEEISILEGRKLQLIPWRSVFVTEKNNYRWFLKKILDGNYFKMWNDYFNDQIAFREEMVQEYTKIQKGLKKSYINGVYLGDNGYMFSIPNEEINEAIIEKKKEYFNSIKGEFQQSSIYLAAYPSKDMIYSKSLPIEHYQSQQTWLEKLLSQIDEEKVKVLNLYDFMKDKEDLFYKTDHHWNMNGTYLGYENLIKLISKEFPEVGQPKDKDFFTIETYDKVFVGSDGRKVGQLVKEQEDIQVYRSPEEEKFNVKINGEEAKFYYLEEINSHKYNNDYLVYINGDNAETIVENTKANNNLTIAIIGDSMDNPLIPLMAENFNKIYSFDLRRYKENITSKLHELNPDIILINGLASGFFSDVPLFKIVDY